jgi:hypothetical protein
LVAAGNAAEGGGWGPVVGAGGETLTTGRRQWRYANTQSGGALGIAAWRADKDWFRRTAIMDAISHGRMMSPRGDLTMMPGTRLLFDGIYKLDPRAARYLGTFFMNNFGFDISKIGITFGHTLGASAYTIDNGIVIDQDVWESMDSWDRYSLLAHEITHCVQYEMIRKMGGGLPSFLSRYFDEYFGPDNYGPSKLNGAGEQLGKLDVLDPNYTLDNIADFVKQEFQKTLPSPSSLGQR